MRTAMSGLSRPVAAGQYTGFVICRRDDTNFKAGWSFGLCFLGNSAKFIGA